MTEPPNFYGQINYASEHTIYRIYFLSEGIAFIRAGRKELHLSGAGGLAYAAISSSIHAILDSGPAHLSDAPSALETGFPLEALLREHRRNFLASEKDISNTKITLPRMPWSANPHRLVWKMHVRERGNLKIVVASNLLGLATRLRIDRFGDIITGGWCWDPHAQDFRRR